MLVSHRQRKGLADTVRMLFGAERCRIQVAALPFRLGPDSVEIMLVTSRDTGRWVLPKGWPERGEALCDAAAREAGEEAGISGAVATSSLGHFRYMKQRASGSDRQYQVHVFAMEVDRIKDKWPERKQRKRAWFSPDEAAANVHEPDLGSLIVRFGRDPRKTAASFGIGDRLVSVAV